MKCISEIIQRLLVEVASGGDVDLNDIKRDATQKYKVLFSLLRPFVARRCAADTGAGCR